MKNLGYRTLAQALLSVGGLILVACNSTPAVQPQAPASQAFAGAAGLLHPILGVPTLPDGRNLTPLRELSGAKPNLPLRTLSLGTNASVVGLKVLILSAGTSDFGLPAAKAMLEQAGVPYDVVNPATGWNASALVAADGSGKYQGVMLTSGNLAYEASPGVWQSALDWAGWNLLWQYEQEYQVRQLSLYTYPSSWPEDYGLRDAGSASGSAVARLSSGGAQVFSDLRPGTSLPINYAYNYPANVVAVPGVSTTPLLSDTSGRVLAALSSTGGRERLAMTFAQNPYLLHSELLSYSLVNWLTKGVYLGEYRRFNQLDIDDWFLAGDVFDAATKTLQPDAFRISAVDALALPGQQAALRSMYPVASAFKFAMMYNGGGADLTAPASCNPSVSSPDKLSSATRCVAGQFDWVSHTKDHLYMDLLNYADSYDQIKPNFDIGAAMGLPVSTKVVLSGDMSGLGYYNPNGDGVKTNYGLGASNPNFLLAAQNSGVKYIPSNHSVDGQWDVNCSSCGVVHPLNPNIFLVPRWPTNMFYSVTNPAQATAAYNSVYAPGGTAPYWNHALSYTEFLDKETDLALNHLLSGAAFPHYMHQDNLRQYSPGRSLAYDWESALLNKYSSYTTLPLKTLRWDDLGVYVQARTAYMKSGLSGKWNRATHSMTVQSANGGAAFVTGAVTGSSQVYAGKTISSFSLAAGQSLTISVP
ncbi:hypothetical protein FNU79_03970 [Deinococcus detaillensis]|uniref:Uncharacterized protein n=1 Tax=Deinococcus detaillensis TaxID=2592048 RepID=A0A553V576_9DEIO|nr:hypothetical protein [Deinococcus detaillensis]TSA87638.1 hypothetical protein FNU79_03970 [Deinococcus detaillensis]